MKKFLALLTLISLLMSLSACMTDVNDSSEKAKSDSSNESSVNTSEDIGKGGLKLSFEEKIVTDNEFCKITVTEYEVDNLFGSELKIALENKSQDTTYTFSVDNVSVNGVQVPSLMVTDVAPGKKANDSITLLDETLEENGIKEYTDIEITFSVSDSDDWMADPVTVVKTNIYPYGEENAYKFERQSLKTDIVIVDNDKVTAIVTGFTTDDIWGYCANIYLVNKTDRSFMVTVDDVSVNGYMCDPFFAESVESGKCSFASMSWSDSDFEDNGITDVETIEFIFRVYDLDNFLDEDIINQSVVLNP